MKLAKVMLGIQKIRPKWTKTRLKSPRFDIYIGQNHVQNAQNGTKLAKITQNRSIMEKSQTQIFQNRYDPISLLYTHIWCCDRTYHGRWEMKIKPNSKGENNSKPTSEGVKS